MSKWCLAVHQIKLSHFWQFIRDLFGKNYWHKSFFTVTDSTKNLCIDSKDSIFTTVVIVLLTVSTVTSYLWISRRWKTTLLFVAIVTLNIAYFALRLLDPTSFSTHFHFHLHFMMSNLNFHLPFAVFILKNQLLHLVDWFHTAMRHLCFSF